MKKVHFVSLAILAFMVLAFAGPAVAKNCNVNAGPIWNQHDAEQKCPQVCDPYGAWTGQWWTTVQNEMSVCQCEGNLATEEAGPIWNQPDAEKKCPGVCEENKGDWTGQWWTTVPNKMSVCQCSVCEPCKTHTVEAGPIWNQQDANQKCPEVCEGGSWNGQWWTTVPNKMSVCQCVACP